MKVYSQSHREYIQIKNTLNYISMNLTLATAGTSSVAVSWIHAQINYIETKNMLVLMHVLCLFTVRTKLENKLRVGFAAEGSWKLNMALLISLWVNFNVYVLTDWGDGGDSFLFVLPVNKNRIYVQIYIGQRIWVKNGKCPIFNYYYSRQIVLFLNC